MNYYALEVREDNAGLITSFKDEAFNYMQDTFPTSLDTVNNILYFAHPDCKLINTLYIEFAVSSANSQPNTLTVEYWDGTAWVSAVNMYDQTKGFTRNGFISWDRDDLEDNQEKVVFDSDELYWMRIRSSVAQDTTEVKGFNIVFSDDNDILEELPDAKDVCGFLPDDELTFINIHQAAKRDMIQLLRNEGNVEVRTKFSCKLENIDEWDILRPQELRVAGKYLALNKIFTQLSDSPDDKFQLKALEYKNMFKKAFNLFIKTIDKDDDGRVDSDEMINTTSGHITRV
jgi:hypothetical protein